MLSVVIATQDSERMLVPTLAPLVAGAVSGLVREVIVADGNSSDETARIADGAGCRVLVSSERRGARLKAAAAAARAPWLMFLRPGIVPDATWVDECRRFIEQTELHGSAGTCAAMFRSAAPGYRPTLVEALALLRAALGARPGAGQGLVIAKTLYDTLGGHRDIDDPERDLARRIGRRRLVLLRCGALAVQT